jgi:hypothetical protein
MIISGLIKDHNLFGSVYSFIIGKVKSKRTVVFLISCIGGILPIPGRVVISAGLLNTVVDQENKHSSKYGIIDFLATHHYYWWSPLEKTIAIPMAVLGISYMEYMKYALGPLIISILFILYYVYWNLDESEVFIKIPEQNKKKSIILTLSPLIISILLISLNIKPYIVFPVTCLSYMLLVKEYRIKKIMSYINWRLIFIILCVITLSIFIKQYNSTILSYLTEYSNGWNINTIIGFMFISIISFISSFVLGSSSKYAGIVALLCSIFGIQYLTYFLTLEFAGYILSPTHKCVLISSEYFKTPLKKYYLVLSLWSSLLIFYGITTLM